MDINDRYTHVLTSLITSSESCILRCLKSQFDDIFSRLFPANQLECNMENHIQIKKLSDMLKVQIDAQLNEYLKNFLTSLNPIDIPASFLLHQQQYHINQTISLKFTFIFQISYFRDNKLLIIDNHRFKVILQQEFLKELIYFYIKEIFKESSDTDINMFIVNVLLRLIEIGSSYIYCIILLRLIKDLVDQDILTDQYYADSIFECYEKVNEIVGSENAKKVQLMIKEIEEILTKLMFPLNGQLYIEIRTILKSFIQHEILTQEELDSLRHVFFSEIFSHDFENRISIPYSFELYEYSIQNIGMYLRKAGRDQTDRKEVGTLEDLIVLGTSIYYVFICLYEEDDFSWFEERENAIFNDMIDRLDLDDDEGIDVEDLKNSYFEDKIDVMRSFVMNEAE